jgi:hypothetical protein
MTFGQNPFNPSRSLPTLAAIQRRCQELLTTHARQAEAQATAEPGELLAVDQPYLLEESRPFEEQEEPQELCNSYPDDVYPEEESEPLVPLPPRSSAPPPPPLAVPALYGIAGRVVCSLAPHTEADPADVLLQFLAAFDNFVGPAPHCRVGATRHALNLFVVLVGESSKARKGTSWRQISSLLAEADPLWSARRVTGDLWRIGRLRRTLPPRLRAHRALKAHLSPGLMAHRALQAHTFPGLRAHRALKAHTFPEAYGADPATEGPKP